LKARQIVPYLRSNS